MSKNHVEYTITIPLYNEEENIEELYRRISAVMSKLDEEYEILFVNDGSTDDTLDKLVALHEKNPKVLIIDFSRNFGRQMAMTAGIDYAHGSAVILMDGDLQHPPEVIPELIEKYKEGYNLVFTVRRYSKMIGIFKKFSSWIFYKVAALFGLMLNPGGTEFMLIDKVMIEHLRQSRERYRFLRGLIYWLGFKKIGIPYTATKRYKGKTKFSLFKMVALGINGIFSFSSMPLYLAGYLGVFVAGAGLLYALYVIYIKFIKGIAIPGWTSVMLGVLLFSGIQLIFLGIVGAYIGRIYEETKARPLYVIKQKIGLE